MYRMDHMKTDTQMMLHAFEANQYIVTSRTDHYLVVVQQHNLTMDFTWQTVVAIIIDIAAGGDSQVAAIIIR